MLYAHDVRKHLNAIREMGQDPDINEYVAKLCGELTTYTQSCQSGNKLLDVMINRYVLDCELKEISFEYSVRECPLSGRFGSCCYLRQSDGQCNYRCKRIRKEMGIFNHLGAKHL